MRTIILILMTFAIIVETEAQSLVLKQAREAPTPITVQPFMRATNNPEAVKRATDLEALLKSDLIFSRLFRLVEPNLETGTPTNLTQVKVDPWRTEGITYLARANVIVEGNKTKLDAFVFDVVNARPALQKSFETTRSDYQILAHMFGDEIVRLVTGELGLFSTKIAFAYKPPRSYHREIWIMDFNGRNARPLIQNGRSNLSPTWSKDGKYIYYTSSTTVDWHLWRTDLKGNAKQITRFPGSALGPSMMPNGREIAVSLSKDGNSEIYLIDLEGKVLKRLTKHAGIDLSPSPSPDGKSLCFSSERLGNLHVFRLNLETLETNRLTRVGTQNDSCEWNPKENLILFAGQDTDRDFDIFMMNEAGESMERLTYDASFNESPSWSPDGKLIAFSSRRLRNQVRENQIFIMKADGTQITTIDEVPGDAIQPSWSPRLGY